MVHGWILRESVSMTLGKRHTRSPLGNTNVDPFPFFVLAFSFTPFIFYCLFWPYDGVDVSVYQRGTCVAFPKNHMLTHSLRIHQWIFLNVFLSPFLCSACQSTSTPLDTAIKMTRGNNHIHTTRGKNRIISLVKGTSSIVLTTHTHHSQRTATSETRSEEQPATTERQPEHARILPLRRAYSSLALRQLCA
ncbi:unnamed protein product [Ixodes persulcatus]